MTTTAARRMRRWTYADYCRIPPDRNRHEIIDGRHYVNPAPSPYHQTVALNLAVEFVSKIKKPGLGAVFIAPIDVHLGRGSVVQPDLVVLRPKITSIIGPKKLTGVPDLLIEILSPSTRRYDRRQKRNRYERAGVSELWLVDPDTRTVEQFVLRGKVYAAPFIATTRVSLRVLRGITIDFNEVW